MVDFGIEPLHKMTTIEAALRRWATHASFESLLLRGGFATGLWVGRQRRLADDLDFLSTYEFAPERAVREMAEALSQRGADGVTFDTSKLDHQLIFADTDSPGVRLAVPSTTAEGMGCLQIDIAFHDPVPFGPQHRTITTDHGPIKTLVPRVEVAFSWKLHGLVERDGLAWRSKDLADLWLMSEYAELDPSMLTHAIEVAFVSRDAPLWRLDRLVGRTFGKSPRSRKGWEKLRRQQPWLGVPDLNEAVETVAARIEPLCSALRREGPLLWADRPTAAEMRDACRSSDGFKVYPWQADGSVFVCERASAANLAEPAHAATTREYRARLLRREARGITFGGSGELLARPYAQFEKLAPRRLPELVGAVALEKLDGSLVFPTPTDQSWTWRTRRRSSDISARAGQFARTSTGNYEGLVKRCFAQSWTPLFEWCSRSRWIVLDHPRDRLVLTGIRRNDVGGLVELEAVEALAEEFRVEVVQTLGVVSDPQAWLDEVARWTDREGCVLRTTGGLLFKVKSDRYRLLHQAVEGPMRDRARWALVLEDAAAQLVEVSAGRDIDLAGYVAELENCLEFALAQIQQVTVDLSDSRPSRKLLAERMRGWPAAVKYTVFQGWDAEDLPTRLRKTVRACCHSEERFQQIACGFRGPLLEDG